MSAITPAAAAATALPASNLPAIDQAREPAVIRNGDAAAKKAYQEGLAFENILVNQLAQELTKTVPGLDGSSNDGLGGTSDSSGGAGGSGGSGGLGAYASLLPDALTSGLMSGGGTGIAMQVARSLDPALLAPQKKANAS